MRRKKLSYDLRRPGGSRDRAVMIAASHIVTGAATGALCRRAWIAVPVAFASHFALDQIPHSCFNMLSETALSKPISLLVSVGKIAGFAAIVAAIVLAWRLPARWVSLAAAVAAFLPDPLCYWQPINQWFALLPGSCLVPWAHRAFHCDVTRTHVLLGFATQAVVIGLGLYVLARKKPRTLVSPQAELLRSG